jgi:phospholipase C
MTTRALSFASVGVALIAGAACDPQKSSWGLDAIRTMATPADDRALGCGVTIPADPAADARAACQFSAGTRAPASLGIDETVRAQLPIRHVVLLMKENRSFDHLLGALHDHGRPDVEGVPPTYSNLDLHGNQVFPSHATTTCIPHDPGHQSASVQASIDSGAMDGWVINAAKTTGTDGHFAMWEYDETDFPFYYWLANTFALSDRHFAPMASGTFSNRNFMMFATNAGVVDTGISFPSPSTPSIMQLMMNRGFSWAAYTDGDPASGALDWGPSDPGVHSLQDFYAALAAGTLPNLVFVDGRDYIDDDHPFADVQTGEAWLKTIYDHAVVSPQWPLMAMIWTYDEAGGFADHVPPPRGCQAAPSSSPFVQLGPRIPLVAISPWAKRGFASHVARDHTAILRFIETVFDLPALTARDANSDALFDLFDFSCGRDLSVADAPAAGTGGCPDPPPLGAH